MFTAKQLERCTGTTAPGLLLATLLLTIFGSLVPAAAHAATVRAVSQTVEFASATTVTGEIVLESAAGVAGVEFSIDYPSTLLATEMPTTHGEGDLFGLVAVNHDHSTGEDPPAAGFRRISVSAAAAQNLTVSSGVLLTLDFTVNCAGFAQDFPDGRGVLLDVHGASAFDENGSNVVALAVDGTLDLNCTTVSVNNQLSFGTIKALFDANRED